MNNTESPFQTLTAVFSTSPDLNRRSLNTIDWPLRPLTIITGYDNCGQDAAVSELMKTVAEHDNNIIDINNIPLEVKRQFEAKMSWIIPGDLHELYSWRPGLVQRLCGIVMGGCVVGPADYMQVNAPEEGLHPRGQARLGEFLCEVAAKQTRVIVQTQSDHIFNAVRLAIKKGVLRSEDVSLYFFSSTEGENPVHTMEKLVIDANGKLPRWPRGLFDEWDEALNQLLEP